MRVTADILLENGWHCGWVGSRKLWEFRCNPTTNSSTFQEAVKLFKNGFSENESKEPVIKIIRGKFPS